MDDFEEAPLTDAEQRRELSEARRLAARRKGHIRLGVAICLLIGTVTACCWVAGAARSAFFKAASSAAAQTVPTSKLESAKAMEEAAAEFDASSEKPRVMPLEPVSSVLSAPTMGVTRSMPPLPINRKFAGITMFRGNATRTYYGEGPVPKKPRILWNFPENGSMTAMSEVAGQSKSWSGTGWTGQPVVAERGGRTEVMFGAYDKKIHFLDAKTGKRVRSDFATGDIIKGTVTLDPDGYPLLYSGSRDDYYHIIALDRAEPAQVWKLWAYATKPVMWNNDWDGNGVVVGDFLFEGGENGHFFIIKLNRGYGSDGKVRVDPEIVLDFPGWTEELLAAIGDKEVSIENSPAIYKDRVYFTNSGGLVTGLDIRGLGRGRKPKPVFRFWTGDDTDASIVVDDSGMLYTASEVQRNLPRAKQNGQIMKLNPYKSGNPRVWGIQVPREGNVDGLGGCWATPALHDGMLYEPTHPGALLGIDARTGKIVWKKPFSWHAWGSASVIDDVLIVPDTVGTIHAYDVANPRVEPKELWQVSVPSHQAIESTPVVWRGRIYVGARDGKFYCFGDR